MIWLALLLGITLGVLANNLLLASYRAAAITALQVVQCTKEAKPI